jgi:RNA polymerase sigma factor (sigma-70 family)
VVSPSEEFERLISRYAGVMSSAIRRVCGRRHRALIPDVEQEVRLALWGRLQGGKAIEHPVSYLYKAALTTALRVLRRHAPPEETAVETRQIENPRADARPAWGLLPAELARHLEQALGRLPPDQARALKAYLAGFGHKEVALLYGWSESVARHRIYQALAALRAKGGKESHRA